MSIHDLSNKVVLLTGIGAVGEGLGNGTAIATLFAKQGATIFGCDINPDAAEKAANSIRNDPEVKGHPARRKGGSPVEVMPESVVRICCGHRISTAAIGIPLQELLLISAAGCDEILGVQKLLRRLHVKTWPDRYPRQ